MDRLFEESFVNPRTWQFSEGQLVPVDVYATNDEVVVEAILPGVKPEEVDITWRATPSPWPATPLDDRPITRASCSRRSGAAASSAPDAARRAGADKATATFEDGILTLRIPKAEQVKPKQIKIPTGDGSHAQPATVEAK